MGSNTDLFYDKQLANDNLTWRLIATKLEVNSNGDDVPIVGKSVEIARGILESKDFSVTISHSYNDGLSDPVGKLLAIPFQGAKAAAPYINSDLTKFSSVLAPLQKGRETVNRQIENFTGVNPLDAANGKFLSAFDLIKTFTGTDVSIGGTRIQTTWLHEAGNNILSRIKNLHKYTLGNTLSAAGIYGLQYAPQRYKPNFTNLDPTQSFEGTFTIEWGTQYRITNLVLTEFNYELSTLKARELDGSIPRYPLYAEITMSLQPASFMTKTRLEAILKI